MMSFWRVATKLMALGGARHTVMTQQTVIAATATLGSRQFRNALLDFRHGSELDL
jgi:hypothetical protein